MLPGPWAHSAVWRDPLQSHPKRRLRSERSPELECQKHLWWKPRSDLHAFGNIGYVYHWGGGGRRGRIGNVWFLLGFFSFFRWKVALCCSVIASGGKSFPTLQQKYAWQGEKCYKSSTSYSWFSAKVKSFWEQLQLVKFFSRLEATLTLRAEETFCYLQELHKWHVCDFFFCLDTVKLGPWSSQTRAGARKGPCCHSKAKGLL